MAYGSATGEMPRAPSISVSPSSRVLLGGWATIHCSSPYPSRVNLYLFKDGWKVNITPKLDRGTAHFPITNVGRHHGGLYSCYYFYWISWAKSKQSEHLELLIIGDLNGFLATEMFQHAQVWCYFRLFLTAQVWLWCEGFDWHYTY
uniref:Ig-like domain-containing protein n=1 Tax=Varanus komodoensis TaxID=61221 RepID=A0A8D2LKW7_VARKO